MASKSPGLVRGGNKGGQQTGRAPVCKEEETGRVSAFIRLKGGNLVYLYGGGWMVVSPLLLSFR
jgi:hypothetical protein